MVTYIERFSETAAPAELECKIASDPTKGFRARPYYNELGPSISIRCFICTLHTELLVSTFAVLNRVMA